MKSSETFQVDRIEMGFTSVFEKSRPFTRLHRHNELELGVMLKGSLTAIFGRHMAKVVPNHLGVFWANQPHGPVKLGHETTGISLFIPFQWFLNWHLPDHFVNAILHGEVVRDRPQKKPCSDIQLMQHWADMMKKDTEAARRIVLLEIEARLLRLADDMSAKLTHTAPAVTEPAVNWGKYEQMVALLAEHYLEPLTIDDVVEAVGLHRVYAMRLFKKMSGMTIQQCIVQHRISHAQRLLATTDKKILAVAMESGFNSATPFYTFFHRVVGQTPKKYRQSLRGGHANGRQPGA